MDHNCWENGSDPVLWEMMIFGNTNDFQERFTTIEAAKKRHLEVVDQIRAGTSVNAIK